VGEPAAVRVHNVDFVMRIFARSTKCTLWGPNVDFASENTARSTKCSVRLRVGAVLGAWEVGGGGGGSDREMH
jgi:hypothetical protein